MSPCSWCSFSVPDNLPRCPSCWTDAGFPNVKLARAEATDLAALATDARDRARARGADAALAELERSLDGSMAVVNVSASLLFGLLNDERFLYSAYGKQLAAGVRMPAPPENDQDRAAADGLLFGSWASEIVFAALSLDGHGLGTYGPISIQLDERMISARASLLEENSFFFIRNRRIVSANEIPRGHRAPWESRRELGVAKLGDRAESAATPEDRAKLVLFSDGKDRKKDEFIEVHVYGSFNRNAVQRVTIRGQPTDSLDRQLLRKAKKVAKTMKIQWSEP